MLVILFLSLVVGSKRYCKVLFLLSVVLIFAKR